MILNTFSTSDSPRKVVIAIHGWTGDISSMEPVAKSLRLPDTKWVIPQAPYKSDKSGFTWFDGNDESGWKYKDSFITINSLIHDLIDQGFKVKAYDTSTITTDGGLIILFFVTVLQKEKKVYECQEYQTLDGNMKTLDISMICRELTQPYNRGVDT